MTSSSGANTIERNEPIGLGNMDVNDMTEVQLHQAQVLELRRLNEMVSVLSLILNETLTQIKNKVVGSDNI